jgi:disulfide bond formation protein DsbB
VITMTDTRATLISRWINILALLALLGVLAGSLHLQFGVGEQPCPLCLVQRSAMIGLAVGPMMNLLWGMKPAHYAISILAAAAGAAGSIRQILLHINDPAGEGYGPAVLGWHLYTWAFVTFAIAIVGIAILLLWNRPFTVGDQGVLSTHVGSTRLSTIFVTLWVTLWVFFDLIVIGISVIPECGLGMCPDNPDDISALGDGPGWIFVLGIGIIALALTPLVKRRLVDRGSSPS